MSSRIKKQLRKKLLNNRKEYARALTESEQDFISSNIIDLVQRYNKHNIAIFYPLGSEIDIKPIFKKLWQNNLQLSLPTVTKKDYHLDFYEFKKDSKLVNNKIFSKIMEIEHSAGDTKVIPDMIITPLAAFDGEGYRLGFGGGFYDKTIKNIRQNNDGLIVIGLAFDFQRVDNLPKEPHDESLDYVITEQKLYKFQ